MSRLMARPSREPGRRSTAEVGGTVKVEITFNSIDLNFPLVPFLDNAQVYRTVTARVEDTTDQGCGS